MIPKVKFQTAQYAAMVVMGFIGAVTFRLFPGWPWFFIGGGILGCSFSAAIRFETDDVEGLWNETVLLMMVGAIAYVSGTVMFFLAFLGFDVALSLLGWEENSYDFGY